MPHPLKYNSRSSLLLEEIAQSCDLFLTFGYNPVGILRFGIDGMDRIRRAKQHRYERQILDRLQKKKLLVIRDDGKNLSAALTEAGRFQLFRNEVLHSDPLPEGVVCMVVFDIPESQASLRRILRNFLKEAGFIPLQRSVWISPFDAIAPLTKLFHSKKLGRWISVFRAERFPVA